MRKLSLVALFLLFCGTFAVAQKVELAGGWNFLHVDSDFLPTQNSVPGGFFIDGTYYFANVIGLTGDFDYNKKTFSSDSNFVAGDQARTYSFHGGPRVKARIGTLEPFAHVLFGVTDLKASSFTGSSVSDDAFSIKLGGGLDVKVFPHLALRLGEFNYYLTKFSVNSAVSAFNLNDHQNNITFSVGAVIR
jgi:opacity protein-like surface antigen